MGSGEQRWICEPPPGARGSALHLWSSRPSTRVRTSRLRLEDIYGVALVHTALGESWVRRQVTLLASSAGAVAIFLSTPPPPNHLSILYPLSTHLPTYPVFCSFPYSSIYLPTCPFIHIPNHPCIYPSTCPPLSISSYLPSSYPTRPRHSVFSPRIHSSVFPCAHPSSPSPRNYPFIHLPARPLMHLYPSMHSSIHPSSPSLFFFIIHHYLLQIHPSIH